MSLTSENEEAGAGAGLPLMPVGRTGGGTRPAPPDDYDLTPGQRVLLNGWAAGLHARTRGFLHHLAVYGAHYARRTGGFVPVSADYIRAEFRQAEREIPALVGAGLVEMIRHDRARGLSREYRLEPSLMAAFHAAAVDDLPDGREVAPGGIARAAERATGGAVDAPPAVTVFVDERGAPYPDLVVRALRSVRSSPVDLPAAFDYLRMLGGAFISAETAHGADSREFRRAFRQFVQARNSVRAVLQQRPTPTSGGLHDYDIALTVQSSGRLGEVGGGLQAAPAALKAAMRGSIPGLQNYDLPSAQPRLALARMEAVGLDAPALARYVLDPDERGRLGVEAGLGTSGVKRVVIAALMGASMPTPEQALVAKDRVSQTVLTAVGVDWKEWIARSVPHAERLAVLPAVSAVIAAADVLAPLFGEFARWHGRLRALRLGDAATGESGPAGFVIRNRLGMPILVGVVSGRLRSSDLGRLVAHLLQGDESAYAHSLAAELDSSGIRVVGHEHDGLVVMGEISQEVEARAAAAVGLPYIGMVRKPFV